MIAVPSGRSGGVVDDVVMDFSVGLQVPFQKNGAPRSGERIEKLNFLMRANARSPGCRLFDISRFSALQKRQVQTFRQQALNSEFKAITCIPELIFSIFPNLT